MRHIIIDTDPGVDDALALLLAFNSPELEVEAITTVAGNVSQEKAHANAKRLLEFIGRTDVPVARGAERPLLRERNHSEMIHGMTGLGGARLPEPTMESSPHRAHELIIGKAEEMGKDLTLVAVGPLTNVATAILAEPKLPRIVSGLVIMGGAYHLTPYGMGNVSAEAEFNIWFDPEAAKIVFGSGIPMVAAGLDTTTNPEYRMSSDMFEGIEEMKGRRAGLVSDLCRGIVGRYKGISLHDPMALAYVIDHTMFETQRYKVDVEIYGNLTRGMTVIDHRTYVRVAAMEENVEIIVKVDAERFLGLFLDRVLGGD